MSVAEILLFQMISSLFDGAGALLSPNRPAASSVIVCPRPTTSITGAMPDLFHRCSVHNVVHGDDGPNMCVCGVGSTYEHKMIKLNAANNKSFSSLISEIKF